MSNVTVAHRPQLITPDNHGGYITITAALMMVWMTLFYVIRLTVRFAFNNFFAADDVISTVGTVFGVAQAITTITAVKGGLGKHIRNLSSNNVTQLEMTVFAADILFIITICLAKISTSELVARLTRKKEHRIACRITSIIIAMWGIASCFAVGTGCHPSHPWDMVDRCSNLSTSWIGIGLVDVIIEIVLLVLPIYLVWPLQMPMKSKFVVTLAFSCRVPIIPMAILRLLTLNNISGSTDYSFDIVLAIVYAQVEMHFSLIAATIPCLRPFLKAWNTGYLATQAGQVDRTRIPGEDSSYALQSKGSTQGGTSQRNSYVGKSPRASRAHTIDEKPPQLPSQLPPHLEAAEDLPLDPFSIPSITTIRHGDGRSRYERSPSSDGSDRLIIKKTVGYTVQYSTDGAGQKQ